MIITVTHLNGTKSKCALSLTRKLAETGAKVLLIDLSCDAFTTYLLGLQNSKFNMTEVMDGTIKLSKALVDYDNFTFAPTNEQLYLIDVLLATAKNRNSHLTQALSRQLDHFDYIIIDCDSSFSFLTINALYTSDAAVLPTFSNNLSQNLNISIHRTGCEQIMQQKITTLTNKQDVFDQLLESISNGKRIFNLEYPIWTNQFLIPEFVNSSVYHKNQITEHLNGFKVHLN